MSADLLTTQEAHFVNATLAQAGDSLSLARRIQQALAEMTPTGRLWRASTRN